MKTLTDPSVADAPRSFGITLLLAASLAALLPSFGLAQDEEGEPPAPSKELVEDTVATLERILDDGAFDEKVDAIASAALVHHDDVAEAIDEAIDDDALEVRIAGAKALGAMPVEEALDALHRRAKKKKSMEPAELAVAIVKAIGMHGDRSSIGILEDDVIGADDGVARARILALGRIRHEDSVEALMGIMNKLRVGKRGGGYKNMSELRLALHVLTGADEGLDRRDWQSWWNDNKRDLEIAANAPDLDSKLERQWRQFWGERDGKKDRDGGDGDDGDRDDHGSDEADGGAATGGRNRR